MKNKNKFLFMAVIALLLATLACGGSGTGDLPETTSAPEESSSEATQEVTESTEEASAEAGGIYDGDWVGVNTVDDNKEILFTVTNNQVTSVSLNYTGQSGDCDYHGAVSAGSGTGSMDAVDIASDGFSLVYQSVNDELTFAGTFTSESEANGTLLIKSPSSGLCGEYEKEVTWTATKGSATESTEDTSGTVSDDDSNEILNSFFDAVNAGDVDTAMSMVDDNVMFMLGAQTQFGHDNLESFLSSAGLTFEISDIESFGGGMIEFQAVASDGATYTYCTVLLQDGKIISLSLQP